MLFRKLRLITTILFVGLTMSLQSTAQHTRYVLTDLGTLGGTFSIGFAINNKGSVTGVSTTPGDSAQHAFLWRKGVMTDLGTLGGINSVARDRLNERDQVAGRAARPGSPAPTQPDTRLPCDLPGQPPLIARGERGCDDRHWPG